MAELGRRLEALEKPKAEARKGQRTDLQPEGKFPSGSTGKTADKVGAALGVSGKTYEAAKAVVENGVPAVGIPTAGVSSVFTARTSGDTGSSMAC